ncbi:MULTISPECIES: hypothetical protein [Pseudomonas]|uniref:Uncharacterized protein n=1 Tax=Pseudomonas sessilinigenes TaxID=658629 RepID=A0ABX8MHZ4_9PSED|nr:MULTISPECIES: hypothetical protein [Pseudomonas]AZC27144.1 hypothetical protein C4K39_5502 [Pseudomonas sessilinigenes]QIH07529.1 hypothetical protein ATY02_12780 [Pseudomonas sp. BIOMIG1BAC]QXH38916.1 hypothetical protein KSS89_22045 [Pseudomonas sessilinigenes]
MTSAIAPKRPATLFAGFFSAVDQAPSMGLETLIYLGSGVFPNGGEGLRHGLSGD